MIIANCVRYLFACLFVTRTRKRAGYCNRVGVRVCIYILYMSSKKIVIERTRDLIYLKFVATDFSPKISSPSTGENSGDSV